MRPPRPWVPGDQPETVLPAWMYARREPRFPHLVIHPAEPRPGRDHRPASLRPRRPHRTGSRPHTALAVLIAAALVLGAALHGCVSLTAACSL